MQGDNQDFQNIHHAAPEEHDAQQATNTPEAAPETWQYCGPSNITKILRGEVYLAVATMAQQDIETLVQDYPMYAAWFKKG
jgi:hypothetical protein